MHSYLFDLDGCIWFGDELAAGAAALVADLRAAGARLGFLTNTSSTDAAGVAAKLRRLGIPADDADVVAPMSVLLDLDVFREPQRVLVVGTEDVAALLEAEGVQVVTDADETDLVLVGKDPDLTYADLAEATQALIDGAHFVALNLDPNVPGARGRTVPGVGAIVAALVTATGAQPRLVGKPSLEYFRYAMAHFGMDPAHTVMIGDRADVDIRGARAAGLKTVLIGPKGGDLEEGDVPDLHLAELRELRESLPPL